MKQPEQGSALQDKNLLSDEMGSRRCDLGEGMDTYIGIIGQGNDGEIYKRASEILRNGGLVAFPTETVYGLGADALNADAAKKIYAAKGRPSDNPLIVHIADIKDIHKLVRNVSRKAQLLMDRFWPGPMTLVFQKSDIVPYSVTGGLETVAVRFPSHETARRMIRESGCYIAAPSANTSGRPSPTLASHVIEDLNGVIDMIIQDDTVEVGIESTIIDVSAEQLYVLRPGYITLEMIQEVVGDVELDPVIAGDRAVTGQPKAPGMKYRHYAPKAQLSIVEGEKVDVVQYINAKVQDYEISGKKVGIMATDETKDLYTGNNVIIRSLGSRADEASVAKHLYAVLREFDDSNVDCIFSEGFSRKNMGQAVMNRLIKAAGHSMVNVSRNEKDMVQ